MEELGIEPVGAEGTIELDDDLDEDQIDEDDLDGDELDDNDLTKGDGNEDANGATPNYEDIAPNYEGSDKTHSPHNGSAEADLKGAKSSFERNDDPSASDYSTEDGTLSPAVPESYYEIDEEHMPEELIPLEVLPSRYANYVTLMAEAIDEYNIRRDTSSKVEAGVKNIAGKREKGTAKYVPRLSSKYRETSRRKEKQKLAPQQIFDDEEEEEDNEGDEV